MIDLSGYKAMWIFAFFDLPVKDKAEMKCANRFRKDLMGFGFTRLQLSVYARFCGSRENAKVFARSIKAVLPPDGEVRLLYVTDTQFGQMEVLLKRTRRPTEPPAEQLMLF